MGDVYKAMNRSKTEDASVKSDDGARQSNSAKSPTPSDAAREGLPYDEVDAVAMHKELSTQPAGQRARDTSDAAVKAGEPGKAAPDRGTTAPVESGGDKADSELATSLPAVAQGMNGYSRHLVIHHDRGSVVAEQYRSIRLQILSRSKTRTLQTHVITSSAPQEGKTVTTLNLGMAFSELENKRTLVIECDLRRPTFANHLNRDLQPGMVQLLRGDVSDVDSVIHPTAYENLFVIPAGERTTGSTEMVSSPRMAEVLERFKGRFDHILIDTPPVISVTDACILGAMADEVLMVVRLHKTPVDVIDRAKRLLGANNCNVAGLILTHQQNFALNYAYKYYYG